MEYYFTIPQNIDFDKNELSLKDFEYRHLVKVLRKKAGDEITVTDGIRNIYICKIKMITGKEIICEIIVIQAGCFIPAEPAPVVEDTGLNPDIVHEKDGGCHQHQGHQG